MTDPVVSNHDEVERLRAVIWRAAETTHANLVAFFREPLHPMVALHALKFDFLGYNGFKDRPQRLTEQPYRTFKSMAIFAAADLLLSNPPLPNLHLQLRLGIDFPERINEWVFPSPNGDPVIVGVDAERSARGGLSVQENDFVAADAFAAISERSNSALKKSIVRLSYSGARHRFVFFYTPDEQEIGRREDLEQEYADVLWWRIRPQEDVNPFAGTQIWALGRETVVGAPRDFRRFQWEGTGRYG